MKKPLIVLFAAIILVVSFATHFAFFGQPKKVVFDEEYFGQFTNDYFRHENFFDIHPPLGKLMFAGFGKLFNYQPTDIYKEGRAYTNDSYKILRLLPTVFGTFFALVIFFLALELNISPTGSLAAGLFVALENGLVVQSRFILMDIFLLFFGFLGLLSYLKYRHQKSQKWFWLASLFCGLAFLIKWTGIGFILLPIFVESQYLEKKDFKEARIKLGKYLILPFVLYFAVFAIHFSLLYKSSSFDDFFSPRFQKTLIGSKYENANIKPLSLPLKFLEQNGLMLGSDITLRGPAPFSSKWYTWPLMYKPILYSQSDDSQIFFIGNGLLWFLSTAAIVFAFLKMKENLNNESFLFLIAGFLLNFLFFVFVSRPMYLYHYLVPLVFAILMLVWLVDQTKEKKKIFTFLVVLCALSFLYFAPLTYDLKISQNRLNSIIPSALRKP